MVQPDFSLTAHSRCENPFLKSDSLWKAVFVDLQVEMFSEVHAPPTVRIQTFRNVSKLKAFSIVISKESAQNSGLQNYTNKTPPLYLKPVIPDSCRWRAVLGRQLLLLACISHSKNTKGSILNGLVLNENTY